MRRSSKAAMRAAKVLAEAMPYIQRFQGKTVVVKHGGAAMDVLRQSRWLLRFLSYSLSLVTRILPFPSNPKTVLT